MKINYLKMSELIYERYKRHTGRIGLILILAILILLSLGIPKKDIGGCMGSESDDSEMKVEEADQVSTIKKETYACAAGECAIFTAGEINIKMEKAKGEIKEVKIGSQSIINAALKGGFSYREGATGGFNIFTDSQYNNGKIILSGNGYTLYVTIRSLKSKMIRFDGHMTKTGEDVNTGGQLRFSLPIDALGFEYWKDPRQKETIDDQNKEYENNYWTDYKNDGAIGPNRKVSRYPYIALSPTTIDKGITLAVPLDSPNIFRLSYEYGTGLYIDFDLGFHSQQDGGPHADFSFVIYPHQSKWGIRSAAKEFYKIFPGFFRKRVPAKREGGWFIGSAMDAASIGNPSDFALAFDEAPGLTNIWIWDKEKGIYSLGQGEPWYYYDEWKEGGDEWIINNPGKDHPDDDESYIHLQNGKNSTNPKIKNGTLAALSSLVLKKDSSPYVDYSYWENSDHEPRFSMLAFPFFPYNINDWIIEYKYNDVLEQIKNIDAQLSGFYLDSSHTIGKFENYNENHFSIPPMKLTMDYPVINEDPALNYQGGKAVIYRLGEIDFVKSFSNLLHKEGRILFGNGGGSYDEGRTDYFYRPYYDAIGIEAHLGRCKRTYQYNDQETIMGRFEMYQKPIAVLDKAISYSPPQAANYEMLCLPDEYYEDNDPLKPLKKSITTMPQEVVEFRLQLGLFYGIWTGLLWLKDKDRIEEIRPLFKKYVPILRKLSVAGWEPVTFATSSSPSIWIERFGGEKTGRFYLTVRNGDGGIPDAKCCNITGNSINSDIVIDLSLTGLKGKIKGNAMELTENLFVPVTFDSDKTTINVSLEPQQTKVFEFSFVKK